MKIPTWYGRRYPNLEDLEQFAHDLGAVVAWGPIPTAFCYLPSDGGCPGIGLPHGLGPLDEMWQLAHELGHLAQHAGPRGELLWSKDERQADRWAACALIPEAAVRRHRNASEDAFVAALSRHFEDLPPIDCPSRRLAGRIAKIRLRYMELQ